jgi:hypothetical protein
VHRGQSGVARRAVSGEGVRIFVHVGTPLALMVRHNGPSPVALTHAQFKLAIHDVQ